MVHRVTRYFFPLVAAFSLGRAAAPGPAGFSDFARWLPGSYDTFRQAGDDEARGTPYRHVRAVLTIVALDGESLGFAGKPVFYLEQALDGQLAQPYRQRVLVLDAGTSGAATLWDYRIANPADLVSATPEKLRALTHERLSREAGCELTWVRVDRELYKGSAGAGGSCHTEVRGATHVFSYSELTPGTLTSLDQGFDDSASHRWGPPPGVIGHIFRKRAEAAKDPQKTGVDYIVAETGRLRVVAPGRGWQLPPGTASGGDYRW